MENTLRQKTCFSLGKSMILGPKIAQDRVFAIFGDETAKNAKNAFWAPKCDFYGNERFFGSEALISCPSRQPCSRQWFLWCFGVHFHPFRTFSLFSALFPPKATFAPKSGFGRKSACFCAFRPFWGSFLHPSANLALDNGFFGVLGSFFPFYPLVAPFCVFFAPKCIFGAKKAFLGVKSGFWAQKLPFGPLGRPPRLAGSQPGRSGSSGGQGG